VVVEDVQAFIERREPGLVGRGSPAAT